MNRLGFTFFAALFLVAACGGNESPDTEMTSSANAPADASNPFFTESTLPYGMPHFDLIRDEHFAPALERGMAEEMTEILEIASNPEQSVSYVSSSSQVVTSLPPFSGPYTRVSSLSDGDDIMREVVRNK